MHHKIGIGIITCNREDLFQRAYSGLPDVDRIVVVNDGRPYDADVYRSKKAEVVQHNRNQGVGISKNDALRFLLDAGCDHIFLSEDDVQILDSRVIDEYIRTARVSGIAHFNFAYHGPLNKTPAGVPNPKKIVEYTHGARVALHRHLPGAFSYYSARVLNQVGLMDKLFKNAFDHLDHTYRIIRAGFHPSFGWFADIADSFRYIKDLDEDLSRSVIRRDWLSFRIRYWTYSTYFMMKHGRMAARIPIVAEEHVTQELQLLKQRFGTD